MIILDLFLAFVFGVAANQLDRPISRMQSGGWELITRYVVGVLAAFVPFLFLIHHIKRIDRDGRELYDLEAAAAFMGSFSFVAIGVMVARGVREMSEAVK